MSIALTGRAVSNELSALGSRSSELRSNFGVRPLWVRRGGGGLLVESAAKCLVEANVVSQSRQLRLNECLAGAIEVLLGQEHGKVVVHAAPVANVRKAETFLFCVDARSLGVDLFVEGWLRRKG